LLSCVNKEKSIVSTTPKKNNIALLGAVRISERPFFVCKNDNGNILLESSKERKIQYTIIKHMIELNPRIKKLLCSFKIKPNINISTLADLADGHMNDTCKVAIGIYSFLSETLKNQINEVKLKEASMLHDLGKALIPSKILNKPSKLNKKERRIMNIHSTLGYELLKTQKIDDETLGLVKYHHQNLTHSGYPVLVESKTPSDIGVQIISTADKYSALREKRVYRKQLSRLDSLLILYKEVREGKIHKEVYNALVEYAKIYDAA